jgi:hypothetical protein
LELLVLRLLLMLLLLLLLRLLLQHHHLAVHCHLGHIGGHGRGIVVGIKPWCRSIQLDREKAAWRLEKTASGRLPEPIVAMSRGQEGSTQEKRRRVVDWP